MGLLSPPPVPERTGLIEPLGVNNGLLMNKVTEDVLGAERLKQRVIDFAKQRSLDLYDIMKQAIDPETYRYIGQELTNWPQPNEAIKQQIHENAMNIGLMLNPMAMGIVSPQKAMSLIFNKNLPDHPTFMQAVSNTPGAQITEDGLLLSVQRGQKPEQALNPSVRGGVMYLPQGAAQMKWYKTGKYGYGGTEAISGQTLVRNPLFVKGATGGKAPETAYDQLVGKGSYQMMRQEALKVSGWGIPKTELASRTDEFLDRYAPEMSGLGQYIVQNSAHGNQLPYALQEAAVSSAVRKAGHDSVLGWSKTKTGEPFISELFDVRESHYPDKFGTSKVFPELERQ